MSSETGGELQAPEWAMSEFNPQQALFEEFSGPRSVWLEVVCVLWIELLTQPTSLLWGFQSF